MRYAEGLHPVSGFLAPSKRFTRTIRIVIIAAVLCATAGSFSLIEQRDKTSVAARTLVTQQAPSILLSAQEKLREPTKVSLSASRTDPTYLAHVQKRRTRSTKLDRITRRLDTCSIL